MPELLKPSAAIPAALLDQYAADGPKGVSLNPDDLILPFIKIIQAGTPCADKHRDADYIAGAEPGNFLLGLAEIRDGREGIEVIPAEMQHAWIEFLPSRGGFVARHAAVPDDVETFRIEGRNWPVFRRRSTGNIIEERREFALVVDGENYLLSCGGTLNTFARRWQTVFRQHRHPKTGAILPAYSHRYLLVTVPTRNAIGNWFTLKLDDLGFASEEEYFAARALNEIVARGAYRAEYQDGGNGSTAQHNAAT
jgi:hypothetical protein